MSSVAEFFKVLGVMILMVALAFGGAYWVGYFFKKSVPNFKYWLKYKVFRAKHKQADVERLLECLERKMDDVAVTKFFLMNGIKPKKAKELIYIYQGMKQLQGGENK